jgi:hypothetical protein
VNGILHRLHPGALAATPLLCASNLQVNRSNSAINKQTKSSNYSFIKKIQRQDHADTHHSFLPPAGEQGGEAAYLGHLCSEFRHDSSDDLPNYHLSQWNLQQELTVF